MALLLCFSSPCLVLWGRHASQSGCVAVCASKTSASSERVCVRALTVQLLPCTHTYTCMHWNTRGLSHTGATRFTRVLIPPRTHKRTCETPQHARRLTRSHYQPRPTHAHASTRFKSTDIEGGTMRDYQIRGLNRLIPLTRWAWANLSSLPAGLPTHAPARNRHTHESLPTLIILHAHAHPLAPNTRRH